MRTVRSLTWLIALLVMKTLHGQGGLPHVVVKDAITGAAIPRVHIQQGAQLLAVTDTLGTAAIEVLFPCTLEFSHISYEAEYRVFRNTDRQPFEVFMRRKVVELPPYEVKRPAPEVIYQRPDLHVADHQVNSHGLWVLAYTKPQLWHRQEEAGRLDLRGVKLHLLDSVFNEKAELSIPFAVRGSHKDHLQRVIIEGDHTAWIVDEGAAGIRVTTIDRKTLHEAVLHWKDTIAGMLLGDDRDETFPAFSHIAYDPIAEELTQFCEVEDPFTMELFRSEYKYMSGRDKVIAMDLEVSTGVDKEIIAGHMTGFHKNIYFHMPYAPMFVVNDTICVFDHSTDRLRKYDTSLDPVGEVPIDHHKNRGWKKELIQDPVTQKVYSIEERNDRIALRPIDPTTGAVGKEMVLTHPWPESVKLYDGSAWYIHRAWGSTQRKTLYREALP